MDVCRSLKCDGLDSRELGSVLQRLLIRKAEEALDKMEVIRCHGKLKMRRPLYPSHHPATEPLRLDY